MVLGLRAQSCQIRSRALLPAVAALLALAGTAQAEGGPEGPRPVAPLRARPDPAQAPDVACSFTSPVCVHAGPRVHPAASLAVLRAGEKAFHALDALRLPRPLQDGSLGGGPAFDLYVLPGEERATVTADLIADGAPRDEASAFAVLPPPPTNAGCALASDVARMVGQAAALGLDAGVEDFALAASSSYFATLAAPCSSLEIEAIDAFQRAPERAIAGASPAALDGAFLFPWFLDDAYGFAANDAVMTGFMVVAGQSTRLGSFDYDNEPDIFDAMRANAKARSSTLDDLLLDFAVHRAFIGSRDDGAHLGDVARFGDAGRVRFEWTIPFDTLPRRLAPLRPIDPTGATYLWLDLQGAPKDAELTFVADWEVFSVFRWMLVKVGKDGGEVARFPLAGIFGSTHAERTLMGIDGLAGVLIVGVNAGSPDRSHPFDPDEVPYAPHSYAVTLVK